MTILLLMILINKLRKWKATQASMKTMISKQASYLFQP